MKKILRILGTRGIPAQHGGFETFAEYFSLYMIKHGWEVIVYCQEDGTGEVYKDEWQGVHLIHTPVAQEGAKGTILFDWKTTLHAAKSNDLILTLGYNTAIFCIIYRLKGIKNIINMDGVEWKRDKWTFLERAWLYLNERAGCWLGNHLVADHPEIKKHLSTHIRENKITMIPYGSDTIEQANKTLIEKYGLMPKNYAIVIARPEPENSILEIVTAFSKKQRDKKLVVLGNFEKADPEYSRIVKKAASKDVIFPGAIYDKATVQALRYFARLYIHGHTVGGTNPSLVEALGAGNAVLAHDNKFNRWVAGNESRYFSSVDDCKSELDELLDDEELINNMEKYSAAIHKDRFTWEIILNTYKELLASY